MSRSEHILATCSNLTGTAFSAVNGLPSGYRIDYNYMGEQKIAIYSRGTLLMVQ